MKLNKSQQIIIDGLELGEGPETVVNPFSGVAVELDIVGVALYDLIRGCEITGNWKLFDQARYLFADKYPKEYMQLLD